MGSGFSKLKKQRKQFEEQMSKMQAELESAEFEGIAGNGLVKVTLNARKKIFLQILNYIFLSKKFCTLKES